MRTTQAILRELKDAQAAPLPAETRQKLINKLQAELAELLVPDTRQGQLDVTTPQEKKRT